MTKAEFAETIDYCRAQCEAMAAFTPTVARLNSATADSLGLRDGELFHGMTIEVFDLTEPGKAFFSPASTLSLAFNEDDLETNH